MQKDQVNSPAGVIESSEVSSERIVFSNPVRLVQRLERERVGITSIIGHLERDKGEGNPEVKSRLVTAILNVESNSLSSDQVSLLIQLKSYLDRQSISTTDERANNANQRLDDLMSYLIEEVISAKNVASNGESSIAVDTVNTMSNAAAGGAAAVLERVSTAPDSAKIAILVGLGIATALIAKNKDVRDLLFYSALGLGAVMIVKPITGRSAAEWADRAINWSNSSDRNRAYADYFGLDYSDANAKPRIDLLIESFTKDTGFSRRSFKDIVGAYNQSTSAIPSSFFANTQFNSVPNNRLSEVMRLTVGMVVDKFGPNSSLYQNNEAIRNEYDALMNGERSWGQGVSSLLSLDPSSPLNVSTVVSSSAGSVNQSSLSPASNIESANSVRLNRVFPVNLVRNASSKIPSQVNIFREGINRTLTNDYDEGFVNRWLNRSIRSTDDLKSFSPPVGERAENARRSPNNIEYSNGVFIGSYVLEMSNSDLGDVSKRTNFILESLERFFKTIEGLNEYMANGSFDFLYGAELKQNDSGQYFIAFSYRNPNNDNSNSFIGRGNYFSNDRNFNSPDGFRLNYIQRVRLKGLYNANDFEHLDKILDDIRRTELPAGMTEYDFARSKLFDSEFINGYNNKNSNQ